MTLALLFPGQGAQHPRMLPWLDAQPEARLALQALGCHLGVDWRERLDDPDWGQSNAVAQVLLTGVGGAAWQVLAARLPQPAIVAGYSVGELAAFSAAGVFDVTTALELAAVRAQAMNDSAAGLDTGLLAVQGPHALRLASMLLPIAIRIDKAHAIVGGHAQELDEHAACWSAQGLRCTRLPIALASHTPIMASAALTFSSHLARTKLRPAQFAVACDFTGTVCRDPASLASALTGQIASTVHWGDCMDSLAERQVHCVLEVGPGRTLSAMWRERFPHIPARSIDEFQGPEGVVAWVRRQLEQQSAPGE